MPPKLNPLDDQPYNNHHSQTYIAATAKSGYRYLVAMETIICVGIFKGVKTRLMGTNYYVKNVPTIAQREEVKKLIDLAEYKEAAEMLNNFAEYIHIGKSSGGWKFIFNLNGRRLYSDTKSLYEWIRDKEITDEYDTVISLSDFIALVDSKKHFKSHRSSQSGSGLFFTDGINEFLDCEFC